jgi:hypothetical protein
VVLARTEQVVELGDLIVHPHAAHTQAPQVAIEYGSQTKERRSCNLATWKWMRVALVKSNARVARVRAPRQTSSAVSPPIDSPPPPFPGCEGATLSLSLAHSRLYEESR